MASYTTISESSTARYTEKMSRFIAFAIPVSTEQDAKVVIKKIQNEYHDARHVCWAYMLGAARDVWQLNDNGEPSGTAGKPILGQINSFGITDVVVIVVRYFGGIKLGTSGLIAAYREAARLALDEASKVERHEMVMALIHFPYSALNDVMKVVKSMDVEIGKRVFDNDCSLQVKLPSDALTNFKDALPNSVIVKIIT